MNEALLLDAFDACLARVLAGEALEACLADYPQEAEALRPLLRVALAAQAAGAVPAQAEARSRARFLAAVAQSVPVGAPLVRRGWWARLNPARLALSSGFAVLVIVLSGLVLVTASTTALPGDPLYGVKRALEFAQSAGPLSPAARWDADEAAGAARRAETDAVLAAGRTAEVEFAGVFAGAEGEVWQIGGYPVHVTEATVVNGTVARGYQVAVVAEARAGVLYARTLMVLERELHGLLARPFVESALIWQLEGVQFTLVPRSVVTGTLRVEEAADARVRRLSDGVFVALWVDVSARAPLPSATPSVPTVTPAPTETPVPSATPTPSATLAPSATASATRVPVPSATPAPSRTQEADDTPEATRTDEPSRTPEPSHTDEADDTPEATRTEEPSRTPELTRTEEPDDTPEPTRTEEPD